jgi:hypothetical protein
MDGTNIFTVLVEGWLHLTNVAKGKVGLKIVSGCVGHKSAKCLTGKELCDFGVVKK